MLMYKIKNTAAQMLICSVCLGTIFLPRMAMLDRENALAGAAGGVGAALFVPLLAKYMRAGNKTVYLLLFCESIFVGGMFLRIFSELIHTVLLPEYGFAAAAAPMSAAVLYGAEKDGAAARLAALCAPILMLAVLLCFFPAAKDMDIYNVDIFPTIPFKAAGNAVRSCAVLAFPAIMFYTGERDAKGGVFAVAVAGAAALAAIFIWLSRFNYITEQPVLDLMYAGDSASSFIRRQEGLILGIVTVSAYFVLDGLLKCAAVSAGMLANIPQKTVFCSLLMLLAAFVPTNAAAAENWFNKAVLAGGALFLLIIPVTELLAERFRKGKTVKGFLAVIIMLVLSGCAGKDPEKREYALELFVHGDRSISVGAAKLSKDPKETEKSIFYEGRGSSLENAVQNANEKTGDNMYFGHLTLCVIDKMAVGEETLNELSAMFLHKEEFGRNVWILAADDTKALQRAAEDGRDIAAFAEKYYGKNGEYNKKGRSLDVNRLMYMLASADGNAQIPRVKCTDQGPEMSGGILVSNYSYAGDISREKFWALQ